MMQDEFKWKDATMAQVMTWASNRKVAREGQLYWSHDSWGDAPFVTFTDGTAVVCISRWTGPYSEVTPDIDAEPPKFWIGEPK